MNKKILAMVFVVLFAYGCSFSSSVEKTEIRLVEEWWDEDGERAARYEYVISPPVVKEDMKISIVFPDFDMALKKSRVYFALSSYRYLDPIQPNRCIFVQQPDFGDTVWLQPKHCWT